jgi:flagellar assembly factor FliW
MSEKTIELTHPLAGGATVAASSLRVFPEGLIGFPELQRFALLELPGNEPFQLLCSADDSSFALVVVDPTALVPDYVLELAPEDLAPLETTDPQDVQIVVPVVLPGEGHGLSLNLKGPILLTQGRGIQRVSASEQHSVRYLPVASNPHAARCSS